MGKNITGGIMEQIFSDNIIYVYFLSCIVILSYDKFSKQQKIALVYATTYALRLFSAVPTAMSIIMLMAIMFILEEYLTFDQGKIILLKRIREKVLDFLFSFIVLDAGGWMILTILLCSWKTQRFWINFEHGQQIFWAVSMVAFFLTIHILSTLKFQVKTYSDIKAYFDKHVQDNLHLDSRETSERFEMLCRLEDQSYFVRARSYNLFSLEFFKYKIGKGYSGWKCRQTESIFKRWKRCWRLLRRCGIRKCMRAVRDRITGRFCEIRYYFKAAIRTIRGCSTLEMQLLRQIGLESGYTCVGRRKVFEYVYTYLFFGGLRRHYEANVVQKKDNFKAYILYIYLANVPLEINDVPFGNIMRLFPGKHIKDMDKDILYAAYLALPGAYVTPKRIVLYPDLVNNYHINMNRTMAWVEWISNDNMADSNKFDIAKFDKYYNENEKYLKRFYCIQSALIPYVENTVCYGTPTGPSYGKQSCWSFAQAVYLHIWGTIFSNLADTQDDMLRGVKTMESRTITVENVKKYLGNAEPGAVIRICDDIRGDDSQGIMKHSQILLSQDQNGVVIYESNDIETRIQEWTWDEYVTQYGKYKYFKYIKWPHYIGRSQ